MFDTDRLRTSVLAAAQPLEVVCWTTTNTASRSIDGLEKGMDNDDLPSELLEFGCLTSSNHRENMGK